MTADLVRDVSYKYIYDKCPVVAAVGPTENLLDYNRIRCVVNVVFPNLFPKLNKSIYPSRSGMYWLRL